MNPGKAGETLRKTPGFRAPGRSRVDSAILLAALSCFAASAVGQESPAMPSIGQADPMPGGGSVLERAIRRLQTHRSVVVQTRQAVDLLGQQLNGAGCYWERRDPGWLRFRLELEMKIPPAEQVASLVRVCDGRYLWTYRQFRDDRSVERVNVDRVRQAWEESGRSLRPTGPGGWPGPGGLSRMLSSLNSTFDFPLVESTQMGGEGPGWKMVGTWKPAELAEILPDQLQAINRGESPDLSGLPPQLPGTVVLWLAKKDLFPRRIEYHRPIADDETQEGGRRPMMSLDFHHVELNVSIPDSKFLYNPGEYTERTHAFIENMRLGPPENRPPEGH